MGMGTIGAAGEAEARTVGAIPAVVITGFLGSGKTTLLNELAPRLRATGLKVAVLVNEMGAVNVDRLLVRESDFCVEVNNGSIFCACVQSDLLAALQQVTQLAPDVLVIEATGVADPASLGGISGPSPSADLCRPVLTVCLAEASNFFKVAQTLAAARRQTAIAQLIVITGGDRCSVSDLQRTRTAITQLNPDALVVEAPFAHLPEQVWEMIIAAIGSVWPTLSVKSPASDARLFGGTEERARDRYETSLVKVAPLSSAADVANVLATLPLDTQRAKGFVKIADQLHLLQLVNGHIELSPAPISVFDGGYLVVVSRKRCVCAGECSK